MKGDYTFDDGFRGARKLFALKNRPSAIFGSNDEIAAGATGEWPVRVLSKRRRL